MAYAFDKTSNGFTDRITAAEGLEIINYYQMDGSRFVKSMSQISAGSYEIVRKDGTAVRLVRVTVQEEQSAEDVRVISYNGGKVHTMMPGMEENPYPLCRGGGMNQNLTKFTTTTAPLSCKTCMTYAERRAARLAGEGS